MIYIGQNKEAQYLHHKCHPRLYKMINREKLILNPTKSNLSSHQKQIEQLKLNFSISRPKMVSFLWLLLERQDFACCSFYGEKQDWFLLKTKLGLVASRKGRQKFLHVCANTCKTKASEKEVLRVWACRVPVSCWLGCAADTVKNKAPSALTSCDTKGERRPCHPLCHAESSRLCWKSSKKSI